MRWISEKKFELSRSVGLEPTLPEGIWFLVRRLNHSATTASYKLLNICISFILLLNEFLHLQIAHPVSENTEYCCIKRKREEGYVIFFNSSTATTSSTIIINSTSFSNQMVSSQKELLGSVEDNTVSVPRARLERTLLKSLAVEMGKNVWKQTAQNVASKYLFYFEVMQPCIC